MYTQQTRIQSFVRVDYKQSQRKDMNRRKPDCAIAAKTCAIRLNRVVAQVKNYSIKANFLLPVNNLKRVK